LPSKIANSTNALETGGDGGGVVSSTFGKEAKFILYSFDVKIDGGNAASVGKMR